MRPLFEDLRTEEQRALAGTIRRFVKDELKPYLTSSPEDEFPRALFSRLCAMGLGGIPFPAEYGGGGADYATYALVLEELAVAGGALAGTLSVHGLPQLILNKFGTEEQKRRYLPRLAGGELLGAFALTEPETGSDAAAIATRADADGDGFLISGSKAWITHSTVADLFVVFARPGEDDEEVGHCRVRDPGFAPADQEAVAVGVRARRARRGVGARLGLGQGEGAEQLPSGEARQVPALPLFGSKLIQDELRQAVDRKRARERAAGDGQLLEDESVRRVVGASPAVFGRERDAAEPHRAEPREERARELVLRRGSEVWLQLVLHEAANRPGQSPLLLRPEILEERPHSPDPRDDLVPPA